MSKSSNLFGQPIYGQLTKSLDREKIIGINRKYGGEKYVKSFDGYTHLLTMLYAVIQRFDSLREIETSMTAEVRKLHHVGIDTVRKRSNLSHANAKRSEKFFEEVYRDLYAANKDIVIHANEGVPYDVQFTSAATNDSFMLTPSHYGHNKIIALDRAYISYDKFELSDKKEC